MLLAKKKKIVKAQGDSGFLMSFAGGLICTLLLVVAVPIISNIIIQPIVVDLIGDTAIASLSSGTLVTIVMFIVWVIFSMVFGGSAIFKRFGIIVGVGSTIVMFIVWVIFSMVFGGSAIFKRFGIIGVIALIAAYYLLGRLMDVVIPVAVIILMIIWSYHKARK